MAGPLRLPSPGSKLIWRQRQLLTSQGRCFRCHKKGHRSHECKRDLVPRLAKLPVELLDNICTALVYPDGKDEFNIPWVFYMMPLRLVCREINLKTFEFFARLSFKFISVDQSYGGFQKLNEIAEHATCAGKIETLYLSTWDRVMDNEEYQSLQEQLATGSLRRRQRREIRDRICLAHPEQTSKSFIERSAADGIMLTLALRKMTNLGKILIASTNNTHRRVIRQTSSLTAPTTTHVFSMVLSSLAFSGVKLHALRFPDIFGYCSSYQGVAIQALAVPDDIFRGVSELRDLQLALETNDDSFKNPDTWRFYANTFLQHTPLLTRLWLGFLDKDWKDSSVLFSEIAGGVVLPYLEDLTLDGLRCAGADLGIFLKNNNNRLKELDLRNLDITGSKSFANILVELKSSNKLTRFHCYQVAQNGFRTSFQTLGEIEISSCDFRFREEEPEFKEFLWVNISCYSAVAEEWEGVNRKLGHLSSDVIVTNRTHKPDFGFDTSMYYWIDT